MIIYILYEYVFLIRILCVVIVGRIPALLGLTERGAYRFSMNPNKDPNLQSSDLQISIKKYPVLSKPTTFDIVLLISFFMLPLLFFIQFPIVSGSIVYDKRLFAGIRMMGGHMTPYYASLFSFYYLLYLCSCILACLIGHFTKMRLFTANGTFILQTILLLWGFNLIGLSFIFSTMFETQRMTLILAYLVVFVSNFIGRGMTNDS